MPTFYENCIIFFSRYREQDDAMEHEELIDTIMTTKAKNGVKPLQLPKEPKQLNLNKADPKHHTSTKKVIAYQN